MSGYLFVPPGYVPLSDGAPIPGAKLTFSRTGTSTLQDTFSDSDLTVANSNPVVADAEGVFSIIYLDNTTGFDYRVTLTDADDVQIWQRDDIVAGNSASPTFRLVGTEPTLYLQETDASASNTRWRIRAASEAFYIEAGNDGESAWNAAIQVDRTGTTLDTVSIGADLAALTNKATFKQLVVGVSPSGSTITTILKGTATFSSATTVAVSFGVTLSAATYQVALGPGANKTFWVTSKATTGFTLNASSSSSDSVDWQIAL